MFLFRRSIVVKPETAAKIYIDETPSENSSLTVVIAGFIFLAMTGTIAERFWQWALLEKELLFPLLGVVLLGISMVRQRAGRSVEADRREERDLPDVSDWDRAHRFSDVVRIHFVFRENRNLITIRVYC